MIDSKRRYDLDALRAFAMLLGIILHGALSFVPGAGVFWGVQDVESSPSFGVLLSSIHGWRMPLFFLVSGFFTSMLWKKRGVAALLRHRSLRIFVPLVIGMLTIVPLNILVNVYVRAKAPAVVRQTQEVAKVSTSAANGLPQEMAAVDIFRAVILSDFVEIQRYLDQGGDIDKRDPFGSTPLHVASLFGRSEVAILLIRAGADLDTRNKAGQNVENFLNLDWNSTSAIAAQFQIPVNEKAVSVERNKIAQFVRSEFNRDWMATSADQETQANFKGLVYLLFYLPFWAHLWFLYFLCWFVVGFVIVVKLATAFRITGFPKEMVSGWWRYAWLVPLTLIPQFFMAWEPNEFGPDISFGILPLPQVFIYYGIFFAYGAMYYSADDKQVQAGKLWWLKLPIGLAILFPIGLFLQGPESFSDRLLFSLVQVSFAWVMTFGLLGFFHRYFSRDRVWVRYLSDASYWMYLIHVPFIILVQYAVSTWEIDASLKLFMVCTFTSGILLLSYQAFVRWTYIGWLLNGRIVPWRKTN